MTVPFFDPLPAAYPAYDVKTAYSQSLYEHWLGTSFVARQQWPVESFADERFTHDHLVNEFRTDWSRYGQLSRNELTADECFQRYQIMLRQPAVALVAPRALEWFSEHSGRVSQMDATSILSWISHPVKHAARLLAFERDGRSALLYHNGVDDDGRLLLTRIRPDDPPAVDQLIQLGAVHVVAEGPEATLTQSEGAELVAFAVVPVPDAPEVNAMLGPATPRPNLSDLPADIYSSVFIALADEHGGAPLEAVWHIIWETSGIRWLFLNAARDVEDVSRIPYKQQLTPADFLRAVVECVENGASDASLPIFVTYAEGHGHCIYVASVDDSRVTYRDPWPGRSLLAINNNNFGVAARREDESWKLWSISHEEFTTVAYAGMVRAATWLKICGVESTQRYTDLTSSDFFSFFNLQETSRAELDDITEVTVAPGNWQDSIQLSFAIDRNDSVVRARLVVDRGWLTAPTTAPFAFDLVKSYVSATAVATDGDEAMALVDALWHVRHGEYDRLEAGRPHLLSQTRATVLAVLGAVPFGRMSLPCTTIRARNEGDNWDTHCGRLELTVTAAISEGGFLFEDLESGYQFDEYRIALIEKLERELQRRQAR